MFWAFLLGLRLFLLTRHERYTISNVKYNLEVAFRVIKVNAQFKCISKNISSRFSIQPSTFLFGSKTHVYLHVHVKNKIFLQLTYNQYNHFFKLKRILSVLQDWCLKKKKNYLQSPPVHLFQTPTNFESPGCSLKCDLSKSLVIPRYSMLALSSLCLKFKKNNLKYMTSCLSSG